MLNAGIDPHKPVSGLDVFVDLNGCSVEWLGSEFPNLFEKLVPLLLRDGVGLAERPLSTLLFDVSGVAAREALFDHFTRHQGTEKSHTHLQGTLTVY